MAKKIKWIALALCALLALGALGCLLAVYLPYRAAFSTMAGQSALHLTADEAGALTLRWEQAQGADCYCVEILSGEEQTLLHRQYVEGETQCVLPALPQGGALTLRVSSVVRYTVFGQVRLRFCDSPLSVTNDFSTPAVTALTAEANPETDTVEFTFSAGAGDAVRVYLVHSDGTRELLRTLYSRELTLSFGDEGDLPMPARGAPCELEFEAYRRAAGMEFESAQHATAVVTREDLLSRELNVSLVDCGHNVCALTWAETKGEYYELQMRRQGDPHWSVAATVGADEPRNYVSPHLTSRSAFEFRVVAVGGETIEGSEYAAVSESVVFSTGISPIFCTVWPVKDLPAYLDAGGTETGGTVSACKAYCVVDEQEGMFGVRVGGNVCYIDSNYCMINLPEYLGDLCDYRITNSSEAIYMVHEYGIPKITGEVTTGYERVRLADGSYLVPLLYPTAQKLYSAALTAAEEGYRLRIYDSFRPNKATRALYDDTLEILDEPLPDKPYTDKDVSEDIKALRETIGAEGAIAPSSGTSESELTYRRLMTGGKWNLYNFLAQGSSYHNLGVAMDLTLIRLDTGEELEMQTSMHDLSFYSALEYNDDNAKLLARIMKGAAFGDLRSEWWHFQDDEAISTLSLSVMREGVDANCWMADDTGWRYRLADGTYAKSCTMEIDGVAYSFGASGYAHEPA